MTAENAREMSKRTINAEEFISAWKEFYPTILKGSECKSWEEAWDDRGAVPWTHLVTGEPYANSEHSPLGNFLKRKCPSLRYRTEEWKVDLVMALEQNWPTPRARENYPKWAEQFWPCMYEVLVEHEDACGISYEEMAKLILLRARLKVLVTYTHKKSHPDSDRLIGETRKQFEEMLKKAWEALGEDEQTEYLLIIGQLDDRNKPAEVKWYYSTYKSTGEAVTPLLLEKYDSETR